MTISPVEVTSLWINTMPLIIIMLIHTASMEAMYRRYVAKVFIKAFLSNSLTYYCRLEKPSGVHAYALRYDPAMHKI